MDRRVQRLSKISPTQRVAQARGRRRWLTHLVWVLLDCTLLYCAFALAHWLRYDVQLGRDIYDPESYKQLVAFQPILSLFIGISLLVFHVRGLYRLPRSASWLDYAAIIANSVTISIALVLIWMFANQVGVWSRLIFVFVWLTAIIMLVLSRMLLRLGIRWAWKRERWQERVLVIGNRGLAKQVMREVLHNPRHGAKLVGYIDGPPDDRDLAQPERDFRWLGHLTDLSNLLNTRAIDQVIVALPFWAHDHLPAVVEICRDHDVEFRVAPDLYELSFNSVDVQNLSNIPLLGLRKNVIKGSNYALKRAFDISLITLAAPIWIPLWLVAALLIKLSTPDAPTTFKQVRVGRYGKPFQVYKLRTMVPNAEALKSELLAHNESSGAMFKIREDPRVTRLGRVLRKLSIDEIPQLLNVLRGEMSLVGPRPQIPNEVAQYEPWHRRRLEVPPGLTGLWQATGRSDIVFDDMVRLDIYYTEHWSFWLDVRIILLTIPAVVMGRGAY